MARVCSWCGLPDRGWLDGIDPLGTALKPAFEPIVVARKPLAGTVAANVLAWGTGALNIDGCRVPGSEDTARPQGKSIRGGQWSGDGGRSDLVTGGGTGRWPTNVVLDGAAAEELDRQVPNASVNAPARWVGGTAGSRDVYGKNLGKAEPGEMRGGYGDSGGASRFFKVVDDDPVFPAMKYMAKAPTSERPSYDADDTTRRIYDGLGDPRCTKCGKQRVNVPGAFCTCADPDFQADPSKLGKVAHPTVKPLDLMRFLVRLVTRPGGVVLEPFAGSGTTAEAAVLEGMRCIAIEREADYLPLIVQRLSRPLQVGFDFGELG